MRALIPEVRESPPDDDSAPLRGVALALVFAPVGCRGLIGAAIRWLP